MQEVADTGKTRSPSPLSETAAFLYGPPIRGARHGKRWDRAEGSSLLILSEVEGRADGKPRRPSTLRTW